MEVLEGKPLDEVIKANPSGLTHANAFAINRGLCLGLAYAHNKNIIHSDFKPGNVFLTDDERTKILDFGIARAAPASAFGNGPSYKFSHTQTHESQDNQEADFDAGQLGALTPAYASCEMFEDADPHPADDVYALAVVLYQLLTGEHPFKGAPAPAARDQGLTPAPIPGLKRRQWKALQRGLAFSREARSQHAAEFLADIEGSPKLRLALAASVLLLGVTGGYLAFDQAQQARVARPDVPFAAIPQETRMAFRSLLDDGAQFVGFDDLASGLSSYREAYLLHPRNPQALQRIDRLVAQLVERAMASDDVRARQVVLANLEALAAEDDFLRRHASLRDALNALAGG
jgi:serine/threonine protein kinase